MRLLYSEGTDCPGATEPNFMNGDSSWGSMTIGSPKSDYTRKDRIFRILKRKIVARRTLGICSSFSFFFR